MIADPYVERDLLDIFSSAIRTYRLHARALVPLALVWVIPQFFFYGDGSPDRDDWVAWLTRSIAMYTVALFAYASMVHALADALTGRAPDVVRSLVAASSRFTSVFLTDVSTRLLTIASLPFIPFFYVRWFFTTQPVMIEGIPGWDARDRSANLTLGYWWRTASILVLIGAVEWIWLFLAVTAFPAVPSRNVAVAVSVGLQAMTMPFVAAAETVLFFDLAARRRAYELWASSPH